jgi:hypothetical protein
MQAPSCVVPETTSDLPGRELGHAGFGLPIKIYCIVGFEPFLLVCIAARQRSPPPNHRGPFVNHRNQSG